MNENTCPQCGAPIDPASTECKFCGEKFVKQQVNQQTMYSAPIPQQVQPQIIIQQQPQQVYVTAMNPTWPIKSKVAAGILAILLGGIGVHKFYLGKIGMGLLYLLFCWTAIPAFIGVIEGIIYLCSNDENFQLKHHVRLQ
ncbi:TM2 domain-containing protein [Anaerocolumna xylanovorans]|uniref:TM2 domain-containing protein n=1 Tax=Anaerocolumna xylanovorans DSM 12503 TaxID=1121345 RepID=A0A1M7YNQ0_9FIRM|nr:TM2 domain-containing protein [Anaerocolumna xylanovorans]SHO54284.1 TM2 domain-containing protein [Anaerocolumna xylanovorans DSM 12503]